LSSTNTEPNHNHVIGVGGSHSHTATAAGSHAHTVTGTTASGGSSTQDVMNPYYALAYIQRLS
jgi:hypothetical protein